MGKINFFQLKPLLTILGLYVVVGTVRTETEYFSSIAGLENLFETEVYLMQEMQNYLYNLQQHIDELQRELNSVQLEHEEAANDVEGYLNNPINAYRLIKRLYTDWPTFEEIVTLDATRTSDSSMSWQECYLIGEYLYAMQDYNHTIPWFQQSTKMLMSSDFASEDAAMALEFIETIAEYHKTLGDYNSSLELINYVLQKDVTRQSALETEKFLREKIKEGKLDGLMFQSTNHQNNYHNTNEFKLYEKVCRGELEVLQPNNLLCKMHTNNHPYRILQPYKLEELSLDPYVIFIHDIITDHQMEVIKEQAQPHMKRSTVYATDGSHTEVTYYRTSKTAWFKYEQHKYTQQWLQHVNHVTGLNVDHAEDLQIANYGLGGHYEPHFDFFTEDLNISDEDGNRISTAIFYLQDVEDGGGTAFPFLNLLVRPRKGSMLFWYNLHASGDRDYRTKHAGCPVLKGSKWIANVWLRELDQYAARPCDLSRNHEISLPYKNYD